MMENQSQPLDSQATTTPQSRGKPRWVLKVGIPILIVAAVTVYLSQTAQPSQKSAQIAAPVAHKSTAPEPPSLDNTAAIMISEPPPPDPAIVPPNDVGPIMEKPTAHATSSSETISTPTSVTTTETNMTSSGSSYFNKTQAIHSDPVVTQIDGKAAISVTDPRQKIQMAYNEILPLLDQKHYALAEHKLEVLHKAHPDFKPAIKSLVAIYIEQGHTKRAHDLIAAYEKNHRAQDPAMLYLSAHIYFAEDEPLKALDVLKSASPPILKYPKYYSMLAGLYIQNGELDHALGIYESLLEVDPSNARWWLGVGICKHGIGKNAAAEAAIKRAIGLGTLPKNVQFAASRRLTKFRQTIPEL